VGEKRKDEGAEQLSERTILKPTRLRAGHRVGPTWSPLTGCFTFKLGNRLDKNNSMLPSVSQTCIGTNMSSLLDLDDSTSTLSRYTNTRLVLQRHSGLTVTMFSQHHWQCFAHASKHIRSLDDTYRLIPVRLKFLRRRFRAQAGETEEGRWPQYALRPYDQIGQYHALTQKQQLSLIAKKDAVLRHFLRQQPRCSKDPSGRL